MNSNNKNNNGSINVTHERKAITTITTTTANKTPKWRQKLPICLTKWLAIKARTQSADWQHVSVGESVKGIAKQSIGRPAERESIHSFSRTLSPFCALFFESIAVVIGIVVVVTAYYNCDCRWRQWACLFLSAIFTD